MSAPASADLARPGVVHVTSVWDRGDEDAPLPVLRIGPRTPRSDTDRGLLALARARADGILTSGATLRHEPALDHAPPLAAAEAAALARWRSEVLGRAEPPRSAVLSRGEGLDWRHPLWRTAHRPVWLTDAEGGRRAGAAARRAGVECRVLSPAGPREAVTALVRDLGWTALDVELGPSSARWLYAPPCLVDELWLASFLEPGLPDCVRGPAFLSRREIRTRMGDPVRTVERRETSGRWRFERYLRDRAVTARRTAGSG